MHMRKQLGLAVVLIFGVIVGNRPQQEIPTMNIL